MNRRIFFSAWAAPLGVLLALNSSDVRAYTNPRRRVRVRRRIRRHAFIRMRFGRPFWVVPLGVAAGWELRQADRIVIVKEIRVVEKDGMESEVAIVHDASGRTEQAEILREDTADNRDYLEGSVLEEGDTTTPATAERER